MTTLPKALLRSARAIGIGFGAATVVYATQYAVMHQMRVSALPDKMKLPSEWNLLTKIYIHRAIDEERADQQAEWLKMAVDSLVSSDTDISAKSKAWLAGYADLLRRLGLAQTRAQLPAKDALLAAHSIPLGSPELTQLADYELYAQTKDLDYLMHAVQAIPAQGAAHVPQSVHPAQAPVYVALAKHYLENYLHRDALNVFVALHKALPKEDSGCASASVAGYVGQVLDKLNHKEDAQKWYQVGLQSAQRKTPACVECAALLKRLSG